MFTFMLIHAFFIAFFIGVLLGYFLGYGRKLREEKQKPIDAGSYVMPFGKHKGKRMNEVPFQYLHWMNREGILERNPEMKKHYLQMQKQFSSLKIS